MPLQFATVSSGVTAYLANAGMTPIILEGNRFQQSTLQGQTIKRPKWLDVLFATRGKINLYFFTQSKSVILNAIKKIVTFDMNTWLQRQKK